MERKKTAEYNAGFKAKNKSISAQVPGDLAYLRRLVEHLRALADETEN